LFHQTQIDSFQTASRFPISVVTVCQSVLFTNFYSPCCRVTCFNSLYHLTSQIATPSALLSSCPSPPFTLFVSSDTNCSLTIDLQLPFIPSRIYCNYNSNVTGPCFRHPVIPRVLLFNLLHPCFSLMLMSFPSTLLTCHRRACTTSSRTREASLHHPWTRP